MPAVRSSLLASLPLFALRVASAAAPGQQGGEAVLEVLFHADIGGNFAQPSCGPTRPAPPDFADLLAVIAGQRHRAEQAGRPRPLLLLGGNTVGPGLFARGLLEHDGAAGGELLAALLARAGYDAVGLGHGDLSLDRDRLELFVRALSARGIPVLAANLDCDPARIRLCAGIREEVIVERGDSRVAVTATVSPLVLGGLPRALRDGMALGSPVEAIKRVARRARLRGVERLVVLADGPRGDAGLEELLRLQRDLAAVPGVVLVLAAGRGDGGAPALRVLRRDGSPPIVGSTEDTASIASIELAQNAPDRTDPDLAQVAVLAPSAALPPDAAARALLAPEVVAYCQRYGQPVGPGVLHGTVTRELWLSYVLAIMRRQSGTEIAVVNRNFVKTTPFPLTGTFRRADLLSAMPYHATLGRTRLTGAQVASLLMPAMTNPRLAVLGLERAADGGITVNGRPIDRARWYRIATIAFLAQGGDEIFPADAFTVDALPGQPDLRDLVEAFVTRETAAQDGDPTIDPDTDFGRPASRRPLVVAATDLALDLADTAIARQAGYTAPQLVRAEQRSVKGELNALLQVRTPRHETEGRLHLLYGYARNHPAGGPVVSAETADLVALAALYNFRGLRNLSLRAPRVTVPDPYVRLQLESEITRPDASLRDYRHAELTATAGGLFTLTPKLRVRGGPGLRKQLLASGDPGRTRLLVEAGAALDPIAIGIGPRGAVAARFESLVDYVFIDPSSTREHQLRASAKLSFPLLPVLFLTAGIEAFAMQREGRGWGAAYDTTIGLRVHLDAAHQSL
jgi:2',3'-cyclic-nucleotide 2'-phosphodiesterase (5'-nucleotidase family)